MKSKNFIRVFFKIDGDRKRLKGFLTLCSRRYLKFQLFQFEIVKYNFFNFLLLRIKHSSMYYQLNLKNILLLIKMEKIIWRPKFVNEILSKIDLTNQNLTHSYNQE